MNHLCKSCNNQLICYNCNVKVLDEDCVRLRKEEALKQKQQEQQEQQEKNKVKMKKVTKPCELCGEMMDDVFENRRFCGKCRSTRRDEIKKIYTKLHAEKNRTVKTGLCFICGSKLEGHSIKYCDNCKEKGYNKIPKYKTRFCNICGKEIQGKQIKYCKECAKKVSLQRAKEYRGKKNER